MFIQKAPDRDGNLLKNDAFLMGMTKRYLEGDAYLLMLPVLLSLGEDIVERVRLFGDDAEKNPPRLVNYDAFGHRIDRLELAHGWWELKKFASQNRLVAMGYDKKLHQAARCSQAMAQIMFSAYSSTYSCPLAMTDGAVKVLQEYGQKSLKEKMLAGLLAKEEGRALSCGQWMTERIGGSDLKNIETHATLAKKDEDGEHYRLYGLKWFASAVDSDYALVLAKIPQSGPSLFLLKVWDGGRPAEGIKIDRLKNKLGTRGLATAEVRLEGAMAVLIGEKGRGIQSALPLLNITRFYNSLASASIINRAFLGVISYAKKREAFGKQIYQHILHKMTLMDIDAKRCASIVLCLEIARLLGRSETGNGDEREKKILRALIPLAKLILGKWAVQVASEAIEAIGGVGYLEDTEFPQLLRDAQVLPIWEGSSNIMIHELLRAQSKEGALVVLLKDLCHRANAVMIDEVDALRILKSRLQQVSEKVMLAINKGDQNSVIYLEPIARKYAFLIGTCAMALLLAEAKPFVVEKDAFSHARFTTFVENNLCGNFSL